VSRIGKKPIPIPEKVKVEIASGFITITGPRGELSKEYNSSISVIEKDGNIYCTPNNNLRRTRECFGLSRTIISNMVIGVTSGFQKYLDLVGVGYRSQMDGESLIINVGYSHPVILGPTPGITMKVEKNTTILIEGIDKEIVGKIASKIRAVRPPEPYKGKGIRYRNEYIKRKAGKAGKK
jgi:large subunit ribosomal protein L6|tara:strand:+ start:11052 stop:11591 length:540 start_codon:yes stop_codon:yes gene_type:complete